MPLGDRQTTPITLQSSASNAAAATTTGSMLTTVGVLYSFTATARITNGGTGPTIGCSVTFRFKYTSGGNEYTSVAGPASVVNSALTEFTFTYPPGAIEAGVTFSGNTGQAVTVECFGGGERGPTAS